jgi:uroporphyrinogen-III decarboxylase
VIGIPSAFGCDVIWWEKDFPAVKPVIGENPEQVYELPQPRVTDGELGRVLEYTKLFVEKTNGKYPIRLTDIQGPLDSAALIFGHNNFLLAMHTHPQEVHRILQAVTRLTIDFAVAQRKLVTDMHAEFVPSMFQPWIPDRYGISVSNDECVMLSPEQHDEFSVPYLNQISEAFGGIYIHSCGSWTHLMSSLDKVHNLCGLEFGASEATYEPALDHFNGKIVLAARIGLHRDLKFDGMADFVQKLMSRAKTPRGLFINVDITNGIVDESWPATDLDRIYSLIDPIP